MNEDHILEQLHTLLIKLNSEFAEFKSLTHAKLLALEELRQEVATVKQQFNAHIEDYNKEKQMQKLKEETLLTKSQWRSFVSTTIAIGAIAGTVSAVLTLLTRLF